MKKIVFLIAVIFNYVTANAQDFQGVAYYESKTTFDSDFGGRGREMTEEMKKRIAERMKSMFEKTYILTFNRSEATYQEEEKLETPGQGGGGPRFGGFNSSGDYYKNVKETRFTNQKEVFGKVFLIKDSLPKLEWQMGTETKKIGNYTCYKATAIRSVDPLDFRSMRPRPPKEDEEEADKPEEKAQDTVKRRSPLDMVETPSEITVTAWYTPEIPVNMGPGEYNGLPGLILEVSADKTTILCSKITLNPENKEEIKEPSKGKEVTQEEFNEILKEKMEEMRERFQGGNGRRDGGGRRPF
ncbi:GLPGLI family protein [Pustulibacterium marinum]|uniref:GLPGLI family protein n=1 Tax=Pustulibacterium marinum TaxID=1224947 RepID=A0A1I7GP89_9FLAO|nr:GLPGLI family protein [Pustulibacterium marinum]SFU50273.1 GLPGLI family protein [Pustulibacterium marinum]